MNLDFHHTGVPFEIHGEIPAGFFAHCIAKNTHVKIHGKIPDGFRDGFRDGFPAGFRAHFPAPAPLPHAAQEPWCMPPPKLPPSPMLPPSMGLSRASPQSLDNLHNACTPM